MEKKEYLLGSSLGHLGLRSRNNDLSYLSGAGYCGNYLNINGTPTLRSFIYVDVGEPTLSPLFNDWDDAGPPYFTRDLELSGTSICENCFDIVEKY